MSVFREKNGRREGMASPGGPLQAALVIQKGTTLKHALPDFLRAGFLVLPNRARGALQRTLQADVPE
jgi:hypothetical protein